MGCRQLVLACLWLAAVLFKVQAGGSNEATTVSELRHKMVRTLNGRSCWRWLNSTSTIGCAGVASAPLVQLGDVQRFDGAAAVVVVTAAQFGTFMLQYGNDAALRGRVAGVLIDDRVKPAAASYASQFPNAPFAQFLYNTSYAWNTVGLDILRKDFNIPIFLMDNATSDDVQWRTNQNAEKGFSNALHIGEMSVEMHATSNSTHCLTAQTCKPLGGYSVWSSLPPMPPPSTDDGRPIVLVIAHVNSVAFFNDFTQGADETVSGLIAMLTAAAVLRNGTHADGMHKRVVFAALHGDALDAMSSRRLLWEMHSAPNSTAVQGLSLSNIESVIELGSVGRASPQASATNKPIFYVHHQRNAPYGNASQLVDAFVSTAAASSAVTSEEASSSNPGIPPSALMSLLRMQPQINGVVVSDYDTQFSNRYTGSRFDDAANVDAASIVAAAKLVAAALQRVATDNDTLAVDEAAVEWVVTQLMSCMLTWTPGFNCDYARQFMTASQPYGANNRINVLLQPSSDPQNPSAPQKSNMEIFLLNVMTQHTQQGLVTNRGNTSCDPNDLPCPDQSVCAGFRYGYSRQDGLGNCYNATVRFVPSYSTRIDWRACNDSNADTCGWIVSDAAAQWSAASGWPQDPLWTESDWSADTRIVQLMMREQHSVEVATMVVGVLLTAATAAIVFCGKAAYVKHLKSQ